MSDNKEQKNNVYPNILPAVWLNVSPTSNNSDNRVRNSTISPQTHANIQQAYNSNICTPPDHRKTFDFKGVIGVDESDK